MGKFCHPMPRLLFISLLILSAFDSGAQEPSQPLDSAVEDTTIYAWADQMPLFNGCERNDPNASTCSAKKMTLFLYKNMRYPTDALKANAGGTTTISAVVDKKGKVVRATLKSSSGVKALDEEARRLILSMPPWHPGILNGKVVLVEMEIPVTFHPHMFKR